MNLKTERKNKRFIEDKKKDIGRQEEDF